MLASLFMPKRFPLCAKMLIQLYLVSALLIKQLKALLGRSQVLKDFIYSQGVLVPNFLHKSSCRYFSKNSSFFQN